MARIKIAFRTQFKFDALANAFGARHLLSYPVTNHRNAASGNEARLANQLRFKLLRDGDVCRSLIFHLPCALPAEMKDKLTRDDQRLVSCDDQLAVWRKVHKHSTSKISCSDSLKSPLTKSSDSDSMD